MSPLLSLPVLSVDTAGLAVFWGDRIVVPFSQTGDSPVSPRDMSLLAGASSGGLKQHYHSKGKRFHGPQSHKTVFLICLYIHIFCTVESQGTDNCCVCCFFIYVFGDDFRCTEKLQRWHKLPSMHVQLSPLPTSSMAMVDLSEFRNHGAALFSNLGALSPFLQCFRSRAFSAAVSGPGSHTAVWWSRLPGLWPATVSHSFSVCHDPDSLGNTAQVIYGMALCFSD